MSPLRVWHIVIYCISTAAAQTDHLAMLQSRAHNSMLDVSEKIKVELDDSEGKAAQDTECGGQTEEGATKWTQLNENQICVKIDTSSCEFTKDPVYFPSLLGSEKTDVSYGASLVLNAQKDGFRVCAGYKGITPADAKKWKWHINWLGFGKATKPRPAGTFACYSRSIDRTDEYHGKITRGVDRRKTWAKMAQIGSWTPTDDDDIAIMDVSTAHCGFTETPIYVVRVGSHWNEPDLTGCEAVINPHSSGFTVRLHGMKAHNVIKGNVKILDIPMMGQDGKRGTYHVHFAALGKVAHTKQPEYPIVQWHPTQDRDWKTTTWGTLYVRKQFPMLKKCETDTSLQKWFHRHVALLSLTCKDKPFPWNMTNMGQMVAPLCNSIQMHWIYPTGKQGTRTTQKQEDEMKEYYKEGQCKLATVHYPMEPGLPTPPPTPPTPRPTAPPTAAPTPVPPTVAPTKGACCDV